MVADQVNLASRIHMCEVFLHFAQTVDLCDNHEADGALMC